jgi:hypothetical protein
MLDLDFPEPEEPVGVHVAHIVRGTPWKPLPNPGSAEAIAQGCANNPHLTEGALYAL